MGVRILYDTQQRDACLYCSTSEWAFGPLFHDDEDGRSGHDVALDFLRWLDTYTPKPEDLNALGRLKGWHHDPRELTDAGLESAYGRWLTDNLAAGKEEKKEWGSHQANCGTPISLLLATIVTTSRCRAIDSHLPPGTGMS